jgi:hypothetical protein
VFHLPTCHRWPRLISRTRQSLAPAPARGLPHFGLIDQSSSFDTGLALAMIRIAYFISPGCDSVVFPAEISWLRVRRVGRRLP